MTSESKDGEKVTQAKKTYKIKELDHIEERRREREGWQQQKE